MSSQDDEKRWMMLGEKEKDRMPSPRRATQGSSPRGQTSKRGANCNAEGDPPASRGMVIFSVLFYLIAALVMIMANKWVLNSVQVPLFFLFVQLVIAVVLLHLASFFGFFTIPRLELETCRGLLPLVGINVLGLIFNTYCLQYVDASFYQVARGLVLPFTVLLSYVLLASRSSAGALGAVALVCIGFILGVRGEQLQASASALGVALGVFSSLTTSVHAIVVKRSLSVVQGSTMDLVYYNNLLSAGLLGPLVLLSGEGTRVSFMLAEGDTATLRTFLAGAAVTGLFGFLICIAGFLSIKVTSPVTHMVSSAVRGVIQTFLGMWCFGDVITSGRGFGIFFILLGSSVYTYVKDREARTRSAIASHGRPTSTVLLPVSLASKQKQGVPILSTTPPVSPAAAGKLGIDPALANSASSERSLDSGFDTGTGGLETPSKASRSSPSSSTAAGVSLHRLSPSSTGATPRTPSRRLSFDARRMDSGHGRTAAIGSPFGTPSSGHGLYATPPPLSARAAYIALQNQQSPSKKLGRTGGSHHQKSFSVTDLRDILIAPNNTPQRGGGGVPLYLPHVVKEAKLV